MGECLTVWDCPPRPPRSLRLEQNLGIDKQLSYVCALTTAFLARKSDIGDVAQPRVNRGASSRLQELLSTTYGSTKCRRPSSPASVVTFEAVRRDAERRRRSWQRRRRPSNVAAVAAAALQGSSVRLRHYRSPVGAPSCADA